MVMAGCPVPEGRCAIVAERIGLNYDDVNTGDWGNTDVCSDGGSQGGSKQVITSGSAFYNAATDVRDQLFADAAEELGVTPAELDAADGKIFVIADPTQFITHADAVTANAYTTIGRGYSWAEELVWRPMAGFPIGTRCEVRGVCGSACEVAVDTETGEVEILKFANAVDNGKAASLAGSLNQIDGGTEIMVGQAFYFDQIMDPATGATINASFLDHKFPTTLDIHGDRHTAIIVESDDACGPFGAKGMGEPAIASFGCLASAVYNAVGVWINDPPIYPQKILKALGKA
jgi:CO/xanthine dehydrogenase Mo-binding subunit